MANYLGSPELVKARQLLELFSYEGSILPTQTIRIFLHIAERGEMYQSDLVELVGLRGEGVLSSVSRNISLLSRYTRHRRPGPNLVENYEAPENRVHKLVRLTPRGMKLRDAVIALLRPHEKGSPKAPSNKTH